YNIARRLSTDSGWQSRVNSPFSERASQACVAPVIFFSRLLQSPVGRKIAAVVTGNTSQTAVSPHANLSGIVSIERMAPMKHPRWFPALILLWLCSLTLAAQAQQVSVSAADYSPGLAPGAITAAFGVEMAGATEAATSLPLPTRLAGTRVLVNGEAAPLFFVSANQINYLIPEDTAAGDAEVVIERDGVAKSREMIRVRSAAFSIFTQDQSGSGAGAIIDGRTYRGGPFSVHTDQGEQTILALYGTGLGEAGSSSFVSSRVHVYVGGIEAKVHYAGPQRGLAGLDQLNFELPDAVADHGTLPVTVKVDDQPSNSVTLDVVSAEMASVSVALTTSTVSVNGATSVNFSPFPDIDSLKVTLKSFNLVTDKGVEVSVISTPQT